MTARITAWRFLEFMHVCEFYGRLSVVSLLNTFFGVLFIFLFYFLFYVNHLVFWYCFLSLALGCALWRFSESWRPNFSCFATSFTKFWMSGFKIFVKLEKQPNLSIINPRIITHIYLLGYRRTLQITHILHHIKPYSWNIWSSSLDTLSEGNANELGKCLTLNR